jgi:hypothetical protein
MATYSVQAHDNTSLTLIERPNPYGDAIVLFAPYWVLEQALHVYHAAREKRMTIIAELPLQPCGALLEGEEPYTCFRPKDIPHGHEDPEVDTAR